MRPLLIAIVISLLLIGCSGKTSSRTVMSEGFVGGEEGLRMNILQGAPPSVIQDKSITPFAFVMTLENMGEAAVGPGTSNPLVISRLAGFVYQDFSTTQQASAKQLEHAINGAKKNFDGTIIPGEISDMSFENLAYKPDVFDSIHIVMRAELCYDYESLATTKICMKKDLLESSEDASICMLRGPRDFGTSGAPIQVTGVEQAPLNANAIQLNFAIENVGRGVFFERSLPKNLYDACVFEDISPHIYKLEVSVEPVSNQYNVTCPRLDSEIKGGSSKGIVRAPFGAPLTISCFITRASVTDQRVYEDLVNIRLKYRYGEFIEVPLLIQGQI